MLRISWIFWGRHRIDAALVAGARAQNALTVPKRYAIFVRFGTHGAAFFVEADPYK